MRRGGHRILLGPPSVEQFEILEDAMSTRFQIGSLALAFTLGLGLTSGCDSAAPAQDSGHRKQADGSWYGKLPNGTGIYIATTMPRSEWGIKTPDGWFYMTGFTHAGPDVVVNGGYWDGGSFAAKKGSVVNAEWHGSFYNVKEISTKGSDLRLFLEDGVGSFEVAGEELAGLVLHLRIPSFHKRGDLAPYSLIFQSFKALESTTKDIFGYEIVSVAENIPGAVKQPFCYRGDTGDNEPAQFSVGSQWDVLTASRTDDASLVSVSCASGGIGRCQQWGYRGWTEAQVASSGTFEKLVDAHQSCIYMKRADYCGTGDTYTEDGTMIGIDDNFSPAFQKSGGSDVEAVWGPKGAICLTKQRRPDIFFPGCAVPLPLCDAASYGAVWYTQSSHM